ncbi:uncharacterized protein LOC120109604 isoform X1 [Phoenix dactylifera]|uniref:Uncharacterized protein LOC120109604 isoform X1 n=1 Tax=Phoenix dactylifera TaxID=42345 RepID=A0A8B8ZYB5_PHODC|nr:uncharacterized protein LOC120109604 isoform X1 [Phoenix dactylifera]XP_038979300.1 uncharacterized protein LOC120109604 isoform X1 [Phoenix dactylifera]XP_038979301.1 uncharacterized protein LOC120109604 isoform X1 [Phoenix dactylifera]XP_038979303.1 uncharacterized protein LOC120109604 isoform X1 [Phoenix dactylifera]XP_038979304.1 uncharacterized protein LOC120109604 isoform X1 [Phoenix dactylifera]XP_038979305.1 uncharacterized protein LOC120109604 isoform X1 [Phoenix dactylifera]XP_03
MVSMVDVENKVVWEGEDDLMSSIQKKAREYSDPSKQIFVGTEESFSGQMNDGKCMEYPFNIPADEIKLGENETVFCTEKTVTEIELPEMIGCYKDGAFNNIKDICVDEGICSLEKILVENDESSQLFPSSFNYPVASGNSALSKEMADAAATTADDFKSTSREHVTSVDKDGEEQHASGSLSKVGAKFDTANPFLSDISDENISLKQYLPLHEFEIDPKQVEPTNIDCSDDHKHSSESLSEVGDEFRSTNPFLCDIPDETISFKHFLSLQEIETDPQQVEPTNFDCNTEQLADRQKFNQGALEEECFITTAVPSDARQSNNSCGSKENVTICLSQGTVEEGCLISTSALSDVRESGKSTGVKESPAKSLSEDTLQEGCFTSASSDVAESEESRETKENPSNNLSPGLLKDVCSPDTAVPSDAKEANQSSGTMGNPANAELESGVSGAASISGQEESSQKIDRQKDGQAKSDPVTGEAFSDNATASARSLFVHNNHGDLNFSEPVCLSGPIASSGHIPYSGSISLRSDSSTTSTRSFAFPILQSEWNSSPVKMAKADHSHLRKHRGWRVGLLCCRF